MLHALVVNKSGPSATTIITEIPTMRLPYRPAVAPAATRPVDDPAQRRGGRKEHLIV
jgi:hypothetical protein